MDNCPLCYGNLITKISSAGEETFCAKCRNIIVSSTLGFNFKTAGGQIEQCSVDGLPGYKGPGEEAKCYTYEPGNDAQEARAKAKAEQSAYMDSKEAHTTRLALAYFDNSEEIPDAVTNDPKELEGSTILGGVMDPKVQFPIDGAVSTGSEGLLEQIPVLNAGPASVAIGSAPAADDIRNYMGRSYCTLCKGKHIKGDPCLVE